MSERARFTGVGAGAVRRPAGAPPGPLGDNPTGKSRRKPSAVRVRELEDEFKLWVLEVAQLHHWLVVHYRPAKTARGWRTPLEGDKGAPDMILAKVGRLPILAELKSDTGTVYPEQKRWAEAIHPDCYRLWRPRDRPAVLAELTS